MKEYTRIAYEFRELSDTAKEKVKEWYLDDPLRNDLLSQLLDETLENIIPNSELKIQYSLNYCQGDGVNLFGEFSANDLKPPHAGIYPDIKWPTLRTDEWETLLHYQSLCNAITVEENRDSYVSLSQCISFAEDWIETLNSYDVLFIDSKLIENFEKQVIIWHDSLCKFLESLGYKFAYEVTDDEVDDFCTLNNWFFDENGTFLPGV